jgi:hypothetical protein
MRAGSSGSPSDPAGLRALHCATCGQVDHLDQRTAPRYSAPLRVYGQRAHARSCLTNQTDDRTHTRWPKTELRGTSRLPLTPPVQMGTPSEIQNLVGHAHLNAQSQMVCLHTQCKNHKSWVKGLRPCGDPRPPCLVRIYRQDGRAVPSVNTRVACAKEGENLRTPWCWPLRKETVGLFLSKSGHHFGEADPLTSCLLDSAPVSGSQG